MTPSLGGADGPGLTDRAALLAENRAFWEEAVPVHEASAFYGVERFLAEVPGPRARELALLGEVAGLDLLHLQCHLGMETLTFARAGARVVGLDLSSPAVEVARRLAVRAGLAEHAEFVQADCLEAAPTLSPRTFDLVYVTLGSLCWLPSVARWADQVAALLRPGGRLFLHEVHPVAAAMAGNEPAITASCFEEDRPVLDSGDSTYTDSPGPLTWRTTATWNHGLGEVLTALVERGLRLEHLEEHDWTLFQQLPGLLPAEVEGERRFRLPPDWPRFPLSYTLLAARDPAT